MKIMTLGKYISVCIAERICVCVCITFVCFHSIVYPFYIYLSWTRLTKNIVYNKKFGKSSYMQIKFRIAPFLHESSVEGVCFESLPFLVPYFVSMKPFCFTFLSFEFHPSIHPSIHPSYHLSFTFFLNLCYYFPLLTLVSC